MSARSAARRSGAGLGSDVLDDDDAQPQMTAMERTGRQWRYLPDHYPPWEAVWQQWRRWRATGIWARAMSRIARLTRWKRRAHVEPTMVMIDAQTERVDPAKPHDVRVGRALLADHLDDLPNVRAIVADRGH